MPNKNIEFVLPFRKEETLAKFLQMAFGIILPNVKVCANHTTPYRAFMDAYFAKYPVTVWKASRGLSGKSYTLAALSLAEGVCLKAEVSLLGGSGEQSKRVLKYMEGFWKFATAPTQLLASDPTQREQRLLWGNTVTALMASQRSVRGPHPQRLRLDEIDEMDLQILDASMGQTMKVEGINAQTVLSSTHQNAKGTMSEILERARNKDYPVYEWCYKETQAPHGWLDPSEIERKKHDVTAEMWNVEYELQEPSPQNRAIDPEKSGKMFHADLGEFQGDPLEYIEIEPPKPEGEYVTGADWAKESDWTIIETFRVDKRSIKLVAFERMGRLPWPLMVGKFDERVTRYPGVAGHDATGIGNVVDDYLSVEAYPVLMVGRQRTDMLTEYIAAIEREEIIAPDIHFMAGEHKYASMDDLFGGGHLPDTISAGAVAFRVWTNPSPRKQTVIYEDRVNISPY